MKPSQIAAAIIGGLGVFAGVAGIGVNSTDEPDLSPTHRVYLGPTKDLIMAMDAAREIMARIESEERRPGDELIALGRQSASGANTKADFPLAYAWLSIARASGLVDDSEVRAVERRMTLGELSEARSHIQTPTQAIARRTD